MCTIDKPNVVVVIDNGCINDVFHNVEDLKVHVLIADDDMDCRDDKVINVTLDDGSTREFLYEDYYKNRGFKKGLINNMIPQINGHNSQKETIIKALQSMKGNRYDSTDAITEDFASKSGYKIRFDHCCPEETDEIIDLSLIGNINDENDDYHLYMNIDLYYICDRSNRYYITGTSYDFD